MQCSKCNHENRPGVKFCESCGDQLPQTQAVEATGKFCSNCGQPNPLNSSFCSSCGYNLKTSLKTANVLQEPKKVSYTRELTLFILKVVVLIVMGLLTGRYLLS